MIVRSDKAVVFYGKKFNVRTYRHAFRPSSHISAMLILMGTTNLHCLGQGSHCQHKDFGV